MALTDSVKANDVHAKAKDLLVLPPIAPSDAQRNHTNSPPGLRSRPQTELARQAASSSTAVDGKRLRVDRSLQVKRTPSQRPSLSDQLAAISSNADLITKDIRKNAGIEQPVSRNPGEQPPLMTLPAVNFSVGPLSSRFGQPAKFFTDRCEFLFHHPHQASEIQMVMYYAHMSDVAIVNNKLKFRVPRKLRHFPQDFDPQNSLHAICIDFMSSSAAQSVKRDLSKYIPTLRK
jgi:hypothetical protein